MLGWLGVQGSVKIAPLRERERAVLHAKGLIDYSRSRLLLRFRLICLPQLAS